MNYRVFISLFDTSQRVFVYTVAIDRQSQMYIYLQPSVCICPTTIPVAFLVSRALHRKSAAQLGEPLPLTYNIRATNSYDPKFSETNHASIEH